MVHGGDVFDDNQGYLNFIRDYKIESIDYFSRTKWKNRLQDDLGQEYLVIQPTMPNKYNAQYIAWKMWFEKIFPFLHDGLILIGSSLGGTFLAKYLSENKMPVSIAKLFLLAAPFDMGEIGYDRGDFIPPEDYSLLVDQCKEVYLYQSKDDRVVPYSEVEKFQEVLPGAVARIFEDKGHLNVKEFPELVADISSE